MRELLAFLGLGVPMKYVDQFGMEGVVYAISYLYTVSNNSFLFSWRLKS